jgi:glutaminase
MASTDSRARLQQVLDTVVAEVREAAPAIHREAVKAAAAGGKPVPRKADFHRFGIAVCTADGELISAGNAGIGFPLQSISKVFALEIVLEALGERLWKRMGREPSGDPFSSIIDLENDKGIPRNPFINPGALVVCDVLVGLQGSSGPNRHVVDFLERVLDRKVELDPDVMKSDRIGGNLNRSLMYMAKHHDNLEHEVEKVMDAYVHQCAVTLDCCGLARAGFFLVQRHASAGSRGAAVRRARRILATMMLCGMYDGAGEFAYRVGLPAKSGVGGGILAIAPAKASVAVWSPALDRRGNSRLGILGLELLVERLDWSVFGPA